MAYYAACCCRGGDGPCSLPPDYPQTFALSFQYTATYPGANPSTEVATMTTVVSAEFEIDPTTCSWVLRPGAGGVVAYQWTGDPGIPQDYSSFDNLVAVGGTASGRAEAGPFTERPGVIANTDSVNFEVVGQSSSFPLDERMEPTVHPDDVGILNVSVVFKKPDGQAWGFSPPLTAYDDRYDAIEVRLEIYAASWFEVPVEGGFTRVFPDIRAGLLGTSFSARPRPVLVTDSSHVGGPHGVQLSWIYPQAPVWPWGTETFWHSAFPMPVPRDNNFQGGQPLEERTVLPSSATSLISSWPTSSFLARDYHRWAYAEQAGYIVWNYSDVAYGLQIGGPQP